MYVYQDFDKSFVAARSEEFRDQVERRLDGRLSEEEFRPLRLQNGVYLQLHAYMLRIAIPYGTLASRQMRALAQVARRYDKGYGHFTTRQNIQFNWLALSDIPDLLDDLAAVDMHAIQTSGNCIRNVTSDPFAGASADEWFDPRPLAELLRQWSSLHPEFLALPRKFKIAISGAARDRAAIAVHDIGIRIGKGADAKAIYAVHVGGGQGRTPRIAQLLRGGLAEEDIIPYCEAILRVYNAYGRRDNKYKARIKILLDAMGIDAFRAAVETEFLALDRSRLSGLDERLCEIRAAFAPPELKPVAHGEHFAQQRAKNQAFSRFVANNVHAHKVDGHCLVSLSLKPVGGIPGDAQAQQMEALADLAERYSHGELRITHRQNIVLPWVRLDDLVALYENLPSLGLDLGNIDEASDIIACPGLDYCGLATARSIPLAQELSRRLEAKPSQLSLGKVSINISGCINACGHHHVGNIGILGLEKRGEEFYQISLGGASDDQASIGAIAGRGFSQEEVPDAVDRILDLYLSLREEGEPFIDTYRRVGAEPFRHTLYAES